MQDLLAHPEDSDHRFFGVVAIRQGWEVEQIAPAAALYDIGCTARLPRVLPQADGGFRIVTVGGDRFRVLDVVVGDDPPYLQAQVEWLAEEETAEEAAGGTDGVVQPAAAGGADDLDEIVSEVARVSMDLLGRGVRTLFTRYVAEVAALGSGRGRGASDVDDADDGDAVASGQSAEAAVLLRAVADDPTALSWLVASVS